MRIEICEDAEAAASVAALSIASAIAACISDRSRISLAMSGGRSAERLVAALLKQDVDWSAVELFQVDEREVPADDPDSNWRHLAPLLDVIPRSGAHRMPVENANADSQYESLLRAADSSQARVDIVHLGLGADGHTASLVPGDPASSVDDRAVVWSRVYQGHRRLTLTAPVLRSARQVWLTTGDEKADALARLHRHDSTLVASRVFSETAVVIADSAAAAAISD